MLRIQLMYWLVLVLMSLLWFLSENLAFSSLTRTQLENSLMQYTGVMAMSFMSIVCILSLRFMFIDRLLGGLDKVYRLHKWLGISAVIFALLHWANEAFSRFVIVLSGLDISTRSGASERASGFFSNSLWHAAKTAGEWAIYGALILVVAALFARIPYHRFKQSHRLISLVFLLLVFHAVVLTKTAAWLSAFGVIYAILLLLGSLAAMAALLGKIGFSKTYHGHITKLTPFDEYGVIEATINIDPRWPGHKAGQFAFLTSKQSEGAHPYTISSSWSAQHGKLIFTIKALGDWTGQLRDWFQIDMPVTVEGPYGQFDFNDNKSRQIWIGAGIGITPFLAKMKERRTQPNAVKEVDLFICVSEQHSEVKKQIEMLAKQANVRLHWYINEMLSGEELRQQVSQWQQASVWFCGPSAFALSIAQNMRKAGLKKADFHRELFQFR